MDMLAAIGTIAAAFYIVCGILIFFLIWGEPPSDPRRDTTLGRIKFSALWAFYTIQAIRR